MTIYRFKNWAITTMFISLMLLVLAACGNAQTLDEQEEQEISEERKDIAIGLDPYDYATMPAYLSKVILE